MRHKLGAETENAETGVVSPAERKKGDEKARGFFSTH
jgi:hypothetical protein